MNDPPRGIRSGELDSLMEEIRPGNPTDLSRRWPLLFRPENADNIRVIMEDDKVISRAGIVVSEFIFPGCRTTIGGVGHVNTREQYRGRGLATKLIVDCENRLRAQGCYLMQVSGGRGLYTRMGYQKTGVVHLFVIV